MTLTASLQIQNYFDQIETEVAKNYKIAETARKLGLDPENHVPIPIAKNMAERVVGLISVVAPEVTNTKIVERIMSLEKEFGLLDWRVGFKIAEEVAQEKFCSFSNKLEAMEIGIRTGFAYLTLGIVSAPLEGFIGLKIKKRKDGREYFAPRYAGPIRAAGGTAAAISVILSDYLRSKLGYATYDPDEAEINRYAIEINDYHERVTNLQYRPSNEEIKFMASRLPVEVDGDSTEEIEVSNYKNLPRIETNKIRGGVALVMAEGLCQKSAKIWKRLSKWGRELGLEWEWLSDFIKLKEQIHARQAAAGRNIEKGIKEKNSEEKKKPQPNNTFLMDLVAGRPILTHPLAEGGFRLRYGRTRTSGFSAAALNPATLIALNKFIAIGTQLKVERPGKAATVTPCDTIEGPIIKTKDGSVYKCQTEQEMKLYFNELEEIIFLGDILFNYGDFSENGQNLVPAGYCPEWWSAELEKTVFSLQTAEGADNKNKFSLASEMTGIPESRLKELMERSLSIFPSWEEAQAISEKLGVPLHPEYTFFWELVSAPDLKLLIDWLKEGKIKTENGETVIYLLYLNRNELHAKAKRILELLGVPHKIVNKENLVIDKRESAILGYCLGFEDSETLVRLSSSLNSDLENFSAKSGLDLLNFLSPVKIRDKAGTFIGARMGRPEKAKMRLMTGSPQAMFPVGQEGERLRSFQACLEAGKVTADFPLFYCPDCKKEMIYSQCEDCNKKCEIRYHCRICGDLLRSQCRHGPAHPYKTQEIDINYYFNKAKERIGEKLHPDLIKGIRGTSNKNHLVEHLAKAILRAKHNIYVNKDGTTRYDCTELPITHFKPKEIKTSIQRLKELGYTSDANGQELVSEDQVLELKPQDIVLPGFNSLDESAPKVLSRVADFIDELLVKFYGLEPFYNIKKEEDLVGHLVVGLAPHISAGLIGRIIGFSETQGLFAHPMYHAGLRRDCDGDEACIMLLLDALLNFSRQYLPEKRGAKSVPPDTLIYIKEKEKLFSIKIGDLIDSKIENNKEKIRRDKDYEILEANHLETISFNYSNYQVGFYPITKLIRHSSPEWLYEVKTSHGTITVTGDHSLFVTSGKNIVQKEVRELVPGENLITLAKINLPTEIPDFLSKYQDCLSELVKLSAYLIAEGYLRQNKTAEITNTNPQIMDEIVDALQKIGKTEIKFSWESRKDKKPCARIRLSSNLRNELIYLGHHPVRACEKHLPDFIYTLPPELKKLFLETYVKGDGHYYPKKKFSVIYSSSPYLAAELSLLAHSLGLKTAIHLGSRAYQVLFSEYNNTDCWWPLHDFTRELYSALRQSGMVKKEITACLANYRSNKRKKSASKMGVERIYSLISDSNLKKEFKKILDSEIRVERVISVRQIKSTFKYVYDLEVPEYQNFLCGPHPIFAHNTMDAPLVLTAILNPMEIDDQVHGLDVAWKYPLELYEASLEMKKPWEVRFGPEQKKIEQISDRLRTPLQYEGFGYTHPTSNINKGVLCSAYKILPTMEEKLFGQMEIAQKVRAVDIDDVAKLVIQKHFLKDIRGNLRKFSMQQFRCVKCNTKYRRPPLAGKCANCGSKLIFTITEGSVTKYLGPSLMLAEKYDFSAYLKQSLNLLKVNVDSVFGKDKEKQSGLGKFMA